MKYRFTLLLLALSIGVIYIGTDLTLRSIRYSVGLFIYDRGLSDRDAMLVASSETKCKQQDPPCDSEEARRALDKFHITRMYNASLKGGLVVGIGLCVTWISGRSVIGMTQRWLKTRRISRHSSSEGR